MRDEEEKKKLITKALVTGFYDFLIVKIIL